MNRISYPVVKLGAVRVGAVESTWWAGFERIEIETAPPAPPAASEVAYSSSITRPACSCKILNGKRMGQGCSIPTEGFPGSTVQKGGGGDGPSTLAVVGGVAGAGLVLALLAGTL